MLKKLAITGLILGCLNSYADGTIIYDEELPVAWSSIITLSGGPLWGTAGQNQYLYPYPPPLYNYYTYNSDTSTMANAEIFFGLQRPIKPGIIGELGLGVAGVSDAKVTGVVNVNGVPDIYTYQYKIDHVRIELKGKLIGFAFAPVQPYVSGSLGVGFNNTHDYQPTTINPLIYPVYWFGSRSTYAFSYSLGAGLQKRLNPNWQVGVGYEFADLGKSYLGGDGTYFTQGPILTHLYTHELLFSVSFLFSPLVS